MGCGILGELVSKWFNMTRENDLHAEERTGNQLHDTKEATNWQIEMDYLERG